MRKFGKTDRPHCTAFGKTSACRTASGEKAPYCPDSAGTDFGCSAPSRKDARIIFAAGMFLLLLELWKQCYLYWIYFGGHYNVWYLPFQLCSLPMYLCPLYALLAHRGKHFSGDLLLKAIAVFLQDFGLLGGIAALLVHEGFTYPGHLLLTLHGYVWHLVLIGLSLYLYRRRLAPLSARGFCLALPVFLSGAVIALVLNILLHPYGDCDMFYLSPYHLSSQPVFRQLDAVVGRPVGMLFYLGAVTSGAFLLHCLYGYLARKSAHRS